MTQKPKQWQTPPDITPPADLVAFTESPLLARLLVQRGFDTVDRARAFIDPMWYQPTSADALPDVDRAVTRLQQAIANGEPIWVWGDFDVDGQTSTTLLVSMLRDLGGTVRYYIPNRMTESHGIKLPSLKRVIADGAQVILSCDTGITAHDAIAHAQQAGVDVIVTDHHDLAETLPPAHAVINPKRLPETHPLRELPGVGVAYKLAEAMYTAANRPKDVEALLDLVALGIVADVAVQTGDTRYLLQEGLHRLSDTTRLGLRVIIENSRLKADRLTEEHIGFWLGPRLNALGRLGDANMAVQLLTTADLAQARLLGAQIEGMNEQRKLLVEQVAMHAAEQIKQTPSLAEYNALVLASAGWHPGVIGISASRLVEEYGKPVILISLSDGSGITAPPKWRQSSDDLSVIGRGSARSIEGCDIHQAIKTQADLLVGFGGHPMAAGLSIRAENIIPFRQGVSAALAGCREEVDSTLPIDAFVELGDVSATLLYTLRQLAPFGMGNPPVTLACRNVRVVDQLVFGKRGDHKRVVIADELGQRREVLWWGGALEIPPEGLFDLAFTLSPDDFHGGDSVQMEWQAVRQPRGAITVTVKPTLIDWRQQPEVKACLQRENLRLIWGEGVREADLTLRARHELEPDSRLVIWTAPPSEAVYQQVLQTVQPQQVYLVGRPVPFDQFAPFIKQILGLLKYSLHHHQGQLALPRLAAAVAHTESTVRLALDWLVAQGKLQLGASADGLTVKPAQAAPDTEATTDLEAQLQRQLAEAAAYRTFFRNRLDV